MKYWHSKKWLSILLAVLICVSSLMATMSWVSAAQVDGAFGTSDFKEGTLADKIIKEDGFINGITYQYIDWGRTFADNQLYGFDTNTFSDGNGAEQVYADFINIKQLGYNAVQIMAGGGKMEGVLFGEHGEILGLSDQYKENFRKYLEIIDATDTNIAVILQFHTTIIYSDLGKDAWDKATQYYGNAEVRKQYMDLVMGPILDILKDFEHRIIFLTLGDELENEINDHYVDWNYDNDRANYGVSFDNMYAFYSDLNDLCKEKMPAIPTTIAANASFLHRYSDLDIDAIGRNRYGKDGNDMEPISFEQYKTGLPMYFPEWGLNCWTFGMTTQFYESENLVMLDKIKDEGYFGAFFWLFDKRSKSDKELTMYNTYYEHPSDFSSLATAFAYEEMDDQYAFDGTGETFDTPRMFAYNGDGMVTWLHSRQGKTFTLERSLDGGKTWTALVTDAKNSEHVWHRNKDIGYYIDEEIGEDQAALYRVTAKQTSGATRTSEPSVQVPSMDNTVEGDDDKPQGVDEDPIVVDPSKNILVNGDFENGMTGWQSRGASDTFGLVDGGHGSDKAMAIMDGSNRWGGIQQTVAIEPGMVYQASLSYKDTNNLGDSSLSFMFSNDGSTWESEKSFGFGSDDNAWHTKQVTFTSDNYTFLRVRLVPAAGTGVIKHVDNVHVELVGEDDNLIKNGYFANGEENWKFSANSGAQCVIDATGGADGSAAAKLTGTKSYTAELSTLILKVEPERDYVLNFDMRSSTGQVMGVFVKVGTATNCNTIIKELWPGTAPGNWENKTLRFNSGEYEYIRVCFANAVENVVYHIDNVTLRKETEKPVRYQITSYIPKELVAMDGKNMLTAPGFEVGGDAWDVNTFVDGTTVKVVTDAAGAHSGEKYLRFEGKGLTETHQAVFYVDVEANTSYTFSAWLRSAGLSNTNNGDVFIGVFDPETGNYLVGEPLSYDAGYQIDFSATRAIKPTAFDGAWHLRGEVFDTGDMTRIGIMISGTNAQMDVDDLTLCKTEDAKAYIHPADTGSMGTKIHFGDIGCNVEDNLLPNYNFESDDLSFWEAGHGYDNYVTVAQDPKGVFGTSLKYYGDNPLGRYFTKWVELEPDTDYILSYNIQVVEDGDGYIGLMDSKSLNPKVFYAQDFDKQFIEDLDFDGIGWITLRCAFNSGHFSRVALVIYDDGGEAYIDNLRLFKEADATEVVNDNRPFDEPVVNNGWVNEGGKWAYYQNGTKVTNKWMKDSIGWCYLGADGYCVTNKWVADSVGWCYLDGNGRMVTNKWVMDSVGWCYLGNDGYCVTNKWVADSKGWCYLDGNGRMVTNKWVKDSVGWCYLGNDGYCVTNKWVADSKGWCYLDGNGRMVTNKWVKDSQGWCYIGNDGYCVTNKWVADSKGWCYLDSNGRMATNQWVQDSKGYCYVGADGRMVYNTTVDGYYINANGYRV